ncbi:hypothetical protein M2323_001235 [Rhodoblastus acidophilus]|uniref:outer membrane protein n=1 Tax=Rhodoblastus acidophilus TaxID=1074 RepID=UPI0022259F90|nr:porin family protein [Rhodoblastus acidophilus]MCW2283351.1 hypothetical protein [Rhodoblastus acidophilus]MCW2332325.1 hypothetical protein [Rhodoblastus acidophilus]
MKYLAPLVALLSAAPVQAQELLPFFANDATLSVKSPWNSRGNDDSRRWEGLTMGTEVFAGSGVGKGGRGGFGGALNIGYSKEFTNNVVVGVGATAGYAPSFSTYWPRGYNFGLASVSVGYDMGRFLPYVTVGLGTTNANPYGAGWQGLDSLNGLFGPNNATLATVGAGFTYEVNEHLRIGAEINATQVRGAGFGPVLIPQPGALP